MRRKLIINIQKFTNMKAIHNISIFMMMVLAMIVGTDVVKAASPATLTIDGSNKWGSTTGSTKNDSESKTWTMSFTSGTIQNSYNTSFHGQQMGTSDAPIKGLTFSADYSDYEVTQVSVDANTGQGATLSVTVNGIPYKVGSTQASTVEVASKSSAYAATWYEFNGGQSGTIVISVTNTAKAFYFGGVKVTYKAKASGTVDVTSVELSDTEVALKVGDTKTVTAYAMPLNATYPHINSWTTDDPSVATVTNEGVITAVGLGKTKVRAHSEHGEAEGVCDVFVASGAEFGITSITTGTLAFNSSNAPAGATISGTSTYTSNKNQLTGGHKQQITITGFKGQVVRGIVLNMKSNASAGAGYLMVKAGETVLASIGDAGHGVPFDDAQWNGRYSSENVNVNVAMTNANYVIKNGENITITLGATTNSLFINSYSLLYETGERFQNYAIVCPQEWNIQYNVQGDIVKSEWIENDAYPTGYTVTEECIGKEFVGWRTSAIANFNKTKGTVVDPTTQAAVKDQTYFAMYASRNGGKIVDEVPQYWLSEYATGCTMATSATITYAESTVASHVAGSIPEVVVLPSAEKAGFVFMGWKVTGVTGHTYVYEAGENYLLASDVTLTAQWKAKHTITYMDGDEVYTGEWASDPHPIEFVEGEGCTLVDAVKTGYAFAGWYKNSNFSGSRTTSIGTDIKADQILYAKWTVNTHSLTLVKGNDDCEVVTENIPYGTEVTITANSECFPEHHTFGSWEVNAGGVALADANAKTTTFTMGDADVRITANYVQNEFAVTYHHAGDDHEVYVETGNKAPDFTPDACSDSRVFVGWSESEVALTQTAPATVNPTTVSITAAKEFWAVYASKNGGKIDDEREVMSDDFETESSNWSGTSGSSNVRLSGTTNYCAAHNSSTYYAAIQTNISNSAITTSQKYSDVSKVSAWVYLTGGVQDYRYAIQYSTDGESWTAIDTEPRKLSKNQTYELVEANMPNVEDAYIRFVTTTISGSTKYYLCIDDVKIYSKPRTFYYTDYATNCDMAESAMMTFAGATNAAIVKENEHVGETVVLPTGVNAGKTFRHWTCSGDGLTYNAGESFVLSHDVTMTAVWESELKVNGDVHLTTGRGIQVYTTTEANNLIELASENLDNAKSIKIQYYDAEDNEITTNSNSLFRLCYAPEYEQDKTAYNVADGQNIPLSDAERAAAYSRKFAISYTPTAAGVENIGKIKFTLMTAGNSEITSTTVTLHGRSLPEKFVVATKIDGEWYALRSDLSASSDNSTPQKAVKISVDNATTPTEVLYAPEYTRYQAAARNAANSYRGAIRLQSCTTNGYLQATESNAANIWLPTTNNAKGMQDWYLSSTDFGAYHIDLYPTEVDKHGRALSVYGGAIGWYTTSAKDFYLLPVHDEKGDMMDIVDWTTNSVTLNMNGYGANSGKWGVGQHGSDAKLVAADRAGDRTLVVPTGDLTQGGLVQINVYGDMATTPNLESSRYYKVPFIFTTNTTISDAAGYDNSSILYVKSGTTTVNVNLTVAKVVVCPGAELVVASGKTLTTTDLVLRGKIWTYEQPKLTNNGTLTVNGQTYYTRIVADKTAYYPFGLPKPSKVEDVRLSNGQTVTYGPTANWNLKSYNADAQLNNEEKAWSDVTLTDGKATIAAKTYYIMGSGSAYYREYYFPISLSESVENTVAIAANQGTETTLDKNKGWNGFASPYTDVYTNRPMGDDPSEFVKVTEKVENNEQWWQHVPSKLYPFFPYFYQTKAAGTLSFGSGLSFEASTPASVAARVAKAEEKEVSTQWVQVMLKNENGQEDETNLYVHPTKFTVGYETSYDVTKMSVAGDRPLVWTKMACGDLAFNALPDSIAETRIAVGVNAGTAKTLSFSLGRADYLSRVEEVNLIDEVMGTTTNLLLSDYEWNPADGTEGRFFLNIVLQKASSTTTGIDGGIEELGNAPRKVIYDSKMFIIVDGKVYDGTGKLVNK